MIFRSLSRGMDSSADDVRRAENLGSTISTLLLWLAVSVFTMAVWAGATAPGAGAVWAFGALGVLGHAGIVSGAAFAVGALVGFLFGIPRTLQNQQSSPNGGDSPVQAVNTNLEQISDWLTKILVGVGLTQFQNLRFELTRLASYFAIADAASVTLALLLNSSVAGFFAGYLLTRLFLAGAFLDADRSIKARTTRGEELQEAGAFKAALNEYENALTKITASTPKEDKQRVYEGAIFNALYEDPPAGFEKAIAYGEKYIKEEPEHPSALIWAYLAAAYGQQYKYVHDKLGKSADEVRPIRDKALQAARRAIEIDKGIIDLLRMMWDPHYPSKSPGDDDLEVFFGDPDFEALLTNKA